MLVRSWNVFHGNTLPPGRRSHLEEMIRLATADRPDVLCLQEVPLWSLSQLPHWSGMTERHVVTRRAPLGAWLGGVITRLNNGFFRSRLAGQANAILLAPGLRARRAPLAQNRRAPQRAALLPRRHARRTRRREPSRHERHPPAAGPGQRDRARRGVRRPRSRTAFRACSQATSTFVRSICASSTAGRRSGRVSTMFSCEGWRPRRSASGRSSVVARMASCSPITPQSRSRSDDAGRGARALPGPRAHRVSQRRHLRAARPPDDRRGAAAAAGRPGARPSGEAVLRSAPAAASGRARGARRARRRRAGARLADGLDDGRLQHRSRRARPRAGRRDRHHPARSTSA